MVLTKHACNDPRGDPNPEEPEIVHNQGCSKRWIFRRRGFWNLKKDLSSRDVTLRRAFPENTLIRYSIEYTIDSRVRGKAIVLNPTILSDIIRITNEGEYIFIRKPSPLDKYVSKKRMYDKIAGHYNQMTNMDAFIIYKATLEESLNLNYIILKEMADVRNHNTRALPFATPLTKIFLHFHGIQFEEVRVPQNVQGQEGDEGYETEHVDEEIHAGVNVGAKYPSHGAYLTQEGPPAWVVELQSSLREIKQQQAEIIRNQRRNEEQLDRLGDVYYDLRKQVEVHGLWNVLGPHPSPPPFDPTLAPPRPPYF
ncbi:Acylphosphatase-1 like [Actinidia chinensis var. chinensis]|uniref:Acylphosphatase-1 like n=1 Tax=Actinidia chinensis var. chinensis TaxID=1590841 RepID=A0A2R6QHE6_ACTCC|nr:Acylphosphatase-1 like [Actinidia chinensis var. chinensis]